MEVKGLHRFLKTPAGYIGTERLQLIKEVPEGTTGVTRAPGRTYMHTNLFSKFQLRRLILMATTGVRLGELLDINKMRDINLETNTIIIDTQVTMEGSWRPLKTTRIIFV